MTRAAVVGTGFIGAVHAEALRRIGVEVTGVVGSSPERARRSGLGQPYESLDAMLADDGVDAVHVTTPNHLHHEHVRRALEAGKHVVCEKPLALDAEQAAELVRLAETSGRVNCVNFNLRFYPQCHEARALVARGDLGAVRNVHGSYLQDWLLHASDWNWRVDPARGGALRAVADIGSHWLDLAQFVTGRRIVAVFADLFTTVPVRVTPDGDTDVATEDAAHILVRFDDGAHGSTVISQVSAGRKNTLSFEVDGSESALAWTSERPEELWLGRRDEPSELRLRDPATALGAVPGVLPAGHVEGFADTFAELYRVVYRAVEAGAPPDEPGYPTFRDGLASNLLGEAVARSAAEQRWVTLEDGGLGVT